MGGRDDAGPSMARNYLDMPRTAGFGALPAGGARSEVPGAVLCGSSVMARDEPAQLRVSGADAFLPLGAPPLNVPVGPTEQGIRTDAVFPIWSWTSDICASAGAGSSMLLPYSTPARNGARQPLGP